MTEYKLVDFEPEHGREIIRNSPTFQFISPLADVEKWVNGWKECGPAYSLFAGSELVGCGGVTIFWRGRGEAWLLLPELFYRHTKTAIRYICANLDEIMRLYSLDRLEANVCANDKRAKRFIEWLGFKEEGMMEKYIAGVDYIRYVEVR